MLETIKITCQKIDSVSFETINGHNVLKVIGLGFTFEAQKGSSVPNSKLYDGQVSFMILSVQLKFTLVDAVITVTGEDLTYMYAKECYVYAEKNAAKNATKRKSEYDSFREYSKKLHENPGSLKCIYMRFTCFLEEFYNPEGVPYANMTDKEIADELEWPRSYQVTDEASEAWSKASTDPNSKWYTNGITKDKCPCSICNEYD
jgi:hypothetical protein